MKTKAEINYEHNANFSSVRYAELIIGGKVIATAHNGTGVFEATIKEWERIVKCVNMHDELVSKMELLVEFSDQILNSLSSHQRQIVSEYVGECKKLLKQAQQQ